VAAKFLNGNESLREACPAGRAPRNGLELEEMPPDCRLVASVSSCPSYRTEDPMAQRHAVVAENAFMLRPGVAMMESAGVMAVDVSRDGRWSPA
jgi:hypothetical protein